MKSRNLAWIKAHQAFTFVSIKGRLPIKLGTSSKNAHWHDRGGAVRQVSTRPAYSTGLSAVTAMQFPPGTSFQYSHQHPRNWYLLVQVPYADFLLSHFKLRVQGQDFSRDSCAGKWLQHSHIHSFCQFALFASMRAQGVKYPELKMSVRKTVCRDACLNGDWSREKLPGYYLEQCLECVRWC